MTNTRQSKRHWTSYNYKKRKPEESRHNQKQYPFQKALKMAKMKKKNREKNSCLLEVEGVRAFHPLEKHKQAKGRRKKRELKIPLLNTKL